MGRQNKMQKPDIILVTSITPLDRQPDVELVQINRIGYKQYNCLARHETHRNKQGLK